MSYRNNSMSYRNKLIIKEKVYFRLYVNYYTWRINILKVKINENNFRLNIFVFRIDSSRIYINILNCENGLMVGIMEKKIDN